MPLRSEDGFTLVETMVAAVLSLLVMGSVMAVLNVTSKSQIDAQKQSTAYNEVRNAVKQIQRDVREAQALSICDQGSAVSGYCLKVAVRTPAGVTDEVRYQLTASTLVRESRFDTLTQTYGRTQTMSTVAVNRTQSPVVPLVSCQTPGVLSNVLVKLIVRPSQTSGTYRVDTTVRPRNVFKPNC